MNRKVNYSINLFISILLVTAAVVLIGILLANHRKQWDMTRNQRYSLAPQSISLMKRLSQPVKVTAFYGVNQNQDFPENLLEQYLYHSKFFSYQFLDPDKNPQITKKYGVTYYPCIVIEYEGKTEKITSLNEQSLTNAILKLTRESRKTIGFITGHGERQLNVPGPLGLSKAKDALETEGYTIKELSLVDSSALKGLDALVIAGVTHDFLPAELEVIKAYLSQGGGILWALDPGSPKQIDDFLKNYGILPLDRMIIDPYSASVGANYYEPMAAKYNPHPITDGFRLAAFFPLCRPLKIAKLQPGASLIPVAVTGPGTWAVEKKRREENGRPQIFPKQDLRGPFVLLLAGSYPPASGKRNTRLVVVGDSDFLSNHYLNLMGNKDLFLNCVGWLTQQANGITIRPKTSENNLMFMTIPSQQILMGVSFGLPVLAFLLALAIWNLKRK